MDKKRLAVNMTAQLLDGLGVLLSGALILDGNASMTLLALATQVPTAITSLMGTVAGVFNTQITIAYAEGDKEKLVGIIKSSNRIMILEIRWNRFYGDILLGCFSIGTITLFGLLSRTVYPIHSWGSLILTGVMVGPLSLLVNFFIILRREERGTLMQMIHSRLKGAP